MHVSGIGTVDVLGYKRTTGEGRKNRTAPVSARRALGIDGRLPRGLLCPWLFSFAVMTTGATGLPGGRFTGSLSFELLLHVVARGAQAAGLHFAWGTTHKSRADGQAWGKREGGTSSGSQLDSVGST